MCPVVFLAMIFSFLMLLMEITAALSVTFSTSLGKLREGDQRTVYFSVNDTNPSPQNDAYYKAVIEHNRIADITNQTYLFNETSGNFDGSFIIRGKFLGITELRVLKQKNGTTVESSKPVEIRILKLEQAITRAFTICVMVLVSLNYINMGCALDLDVVKSVLKKPIAPCVGFFCQYAVMPLIAYVLARVLFSSIAFQLALFTFGCSPGGGASNMWTVLLKGNLNLSLTMTFVTGLCALGMMPFWLFTLGRTLFSGLKTPVPYAQILGTLFIMLVTLGIGLSFQRYLPRVAKFCRRILAPVSIGMILFIIVFGTYANWYMFKLFTWRIVIAATVNVWLGFLFGAITSLLFRLPLQDIIAISIETGVQNTGVAFVVLRYSLQEPESDIASVVPIAASIMTPIPLLIFYCFQKVRSRLHDKRRGALGSDEEVRALPTPTSAESFGSKVNGYVY